MPSATLYVQYCVNILGRPFWQLSSHDINCVKAIYQQLARPVSQADARITVMESLSARLAALSLPDSEGNQVRLGPIWAEAAAVVVFLRHYG